MIPDRATRLDPAGVAAIPAPTSSVPPPPPAPPSGARPIPRRRGVVVIAESDIARLVRLEAGQQIVGIRDDPMRQAFLVLLAGDGLPAVAEFADPPILNGYRYATPPGARIDLTGRMPSPLEVHALVLLQLRPVDLDPPPGSPAAALEAIVRRHAPYQMGNAWWCSFCCGSCQAGESAHWPCGDYVDAAGTVITGLREADHG